MTDENQNRKPPWKSGRYRVEGNLLLAEGIILKRSKKGGPPALHLPKGKEPK
jgi:hypothetical protein